MSLSIVCICFRLHWWLKQSNSVSAPENARHKDYWRAQTLHSATIWHCVCEPQMSRIFVWGRGPLTPTINSSAPLQFLVLILNVRVLCISWVWSAVFLLVESSLDCLEIYIIFVATSVLLICQESMHYFQLFVQSGPKKRYPSFNFAITSVNVHRF